MPPASAESGAASPRLDALTHLLPTHQQFWRIAVNPGDPPPANRRWFDCRYCGTRYASPIPKRLVDPRNERLAARTHETLCPARTTGPDPDDFIYVWALYGPLIDRLVDVANLQTSRIGADNFLGQFDGGEIDSYAFYAGVSFALARVRQTLSGKDSRIGIDADMSNSPDPTAKERDA